MNGFYTHHLPFHKHDCSKCKFLFSVAGTVGGAIDVYDNCDNNWVKMERGDDTPYLIRFSSDGPDYVTVGIRDLAISYAIRHNTEWRDLYT